jgi:hypothetical protein
VAPICDYEPTVTGINTFYDMDIPAPSTYNCAADQNYDDVSLHIKDSYEGDVYVCGATANYYAEFYYCGTETGCINNETLTQASCPGFDEAACFVAPAIGDFHVYLDGDQNGNNPSTYNLGACPKAPPATTDASTTGAGNAMVPAFLVVLVGILAL